MTLTPSKQFINNSTVTFTPSGGSAIPILNVKSVSSNPNLESVEDSGDAQFYNTLNVVTSGRWIITIEVTKPAVLNAVAFGVAGTLTWTENDANNGSATGGGALIFTLVNAILKPQTRNSQHRQVATMSFVFESYSSDGSTSPLSSTAA